MATKPILLLYARFITNSRLEKGEAKTEIWQKSTKN